MDKDKNEWIQIPNFIRRLILSWLLAAAAGWMRIPEAQRTLHGQKSLQNMSFYQEIAVAAMVFSCLCLLAWFLESGKNKRKDTGNNKKKDIAKFRHSGTVRMMKWERCGILAVFLFLFLSAFKDTFLVSANADTFFNIETVIQMLEQEWLHGISFAAGAALISIVLAVYAVSGWKNAPCGKLRESGNSYEKWSVNKGSCGNQYKTETGRIAVLITVCFTVLSFGFVCMWTVCRVLTYSAPTYDFGIFSQMFYKMKMTGLPLTTLERDGLLSHFAVHISPVYYLMLPFYCLYPKPVTLQILQAAVLALAVIPAWKLARKHGCSPGAAALMCVILMLYPAFSGGTGYDLHENVFLILFLLWLFYAIDCENGWQTAVFGVLTLMVKEDAAVYVAVIALWLMLQSLLYKGSSRCWGTIAGALLFSGAVVWFLLATGYLAVYGDGVMTYRYSNFIYDDSTSLFTVVKAAILSPVKVVYECTDPEKLSFITFTMLPLCGIPLMTKRYERFVLLIPYVLVNLMPDYRYQHDIFFQYGYGSAACLFYLTVVNYEETAIKLRSSYMKYFPLILSVVVSGVLFASVVVPKAIQYPERYLAYKTYYSDIDEMLQLIPADASVSASTFYTVPLSNRDILYDVRYSSKEHVMSTEYVVLDIHNEGSYTGYAESEEDGYNNFVKLLNENGYSKIAEIADTMVIYRKNLPLRQPCFSGI